MSRSGYDDYDGCENPEWALIRWRGAVHSALCGKRGQAFLREMALALDEMGEKRLIADELEAHGEKPPASLTIPNNSSRTAGARGKRSPQARRQNHRHGRRRPP